MAAGLTALLLSCTLKPGPEASSSQLLAERIAKQLEEHDVTGDIVRVVDEQGRLLTFGKVALIGVVGNEDGAHHVIAECAQALNDTGFTLAANAGTCWVGEAMQTTDYKDLDPEPEKTASATKTAVANAVHLARQLEANPYPPS